MVRIAPLDRYVAMGKQWSLDENLAPKDISAALKRKVKQSAKVDNKVKHEWQFTVDGVPCAIWDYYGVRWSAFGPAEAFAKIGLTVHKG